MTQIDKETVDLFVQGHLEVGTGAVQLNPPSGKTLPEGAKKGVLLKAPGVDDDIPNTVAVYVGPTKSVTADYDNDVGGFPIAPGESIVVPVSDAKKLWFIAGSTSQFISWIIL